MSEQEQKKIRSGIINGIALAFQRLVEQKQKEDAELAFSENGRIVRIRARELPYLQRAGGCGRF